MRSCSDIAARGASRRRLLVRHGRASCKRLCFDGLMMAVVCRAAPVVRVSCANHSLWRGRPAANRPSPSSGTSSHGLGEISRRLMTASQHFALYDDIIMKQFRMLNQIMVVSCTLLKKIELSRTNRGDC
jgi:hypothetical protein